MLVTNAGTGTMAKKLYQAFKHFSAKLNPLNQLVSRLVLRQVILWLQCEKKKQSYFMLN